MRTSTLCPNPSRWEPSIILAKDGLKNQHMESLNEYQYNPSDLWTHGQLCASTDRSMSTQYFTFSTFTSVRKFRVRVGQADFNFDFKLSRVNTDLISLRQSLRSHEHHRYAPTIVPKCRRHLRNTELRPSSKPRRRTRPGGSHLSQIKSSDRSSGPVSWNEGHGDHEKLTRRRRRRQRRSLRRSERRGWSGRGFRWGASGGAIGLDTRAVRCIWVLSWARASRSYMLRV